MRKATKTVISFAVVLIVGLNFIVPAFAQDPFTSVAIGGLGGLSGAGLFSSMAGYSGINIGWNNNTVDEIDAMWNVLNPDHVYYSGEKHEATGAGEDIYDYITVDIGDWLSAQSDFIVEFATQHNVTDNSYGTVQSIKSYNGYPLHYVGYNVYLGDALGYAQLGTITYKDISLQIVIESGVYYAKSFRNGVQQDSVTITEAMLNNRQICLMYYNNNFKWVFRVPNTISYSEGPRVGGTTVNSPTVNWSSGVVDTQVFDGWEAAKVKIPHNLGYLPVNWDISDFVDVINELWTNNQQGQIVIEDTDQPVPPPPVPTTPLGDVPFDDWVDLWGQGIYQQLENQSDALDLIGSNGIDAIEELESIDTNTEDLVEVAESIDTNIGVGNGILGGIRSLAQSAVNYLEGIAEHVGELVEEIVEGTETLIAGILNQIPQVFSVIFGPIKQASSIWHYVVEWITSIGAPFQFILSMASGTSYYIILPVYASLAAAVVLAFYKRFGK